MYTTRSAPAAAALLLVTLLVAPAAAQTEGRVSVGLSLGAIHPTEADGTSFVISPVVRLNPGDGWGPAAALTWYDTDLTGGPADAVVSRVRVRPVMVGVSYTIRHDRLATSFSVVGGYSFNSVRDVRPDYAVDIENSFAFRPGVSLTYTIAPRVALIGFGGYLITRPDITVQGFGTTTTDTWRGDAVVVSAGVVYSLF